MSKKIIEEDYDLLEELGVETQTASSGGRTVREQRIIAGFEEIERFYTEQRRLPEHGAQRDIFERLYAVRLEQIRASAECREILSNIDSHGLLGDAPNPLASSEQEPLTDEELLASLGVEATSGDDITQLVHVRSREEIKAAEEIANREPCKDFEDFKPLFERLTQDLASGVRITRQIRKDGGFLKTDIKQGEFFIVAGLTAYIAELGESIKAPNGESDARMRVIYSNGTESNLLLRSLQRALYKDEASRRITEPDLGPLFSGQEEEDDLPSGQIYVLRSQSEHPFVSENRAVIHKIGVTGGDLKSRIANAKKEPTYLLADVEIVATFKLANINRKRLEALLHKFFASAKLDMELKDRFGSQVEPREWFLVPLPVIEDFIQKLREGTIEQYRYDPAVARIIKIHPDTGE